ncbi:MAG TPA: hypothetical protein VHB70_07020 [Parafilimonas sp.]|nr:hypothetical protein [Parafilimonas sp.]
MKQIFRCVLLLTALSFFSNSCTNKPPAANRSAVVNTDSVSECSNRVLAALITPGDLQTILNTPGFSKVYMQFKTNDDHSFYPAAYAGAYPFTDVSNYLHPLNLSTPFLPHRPYIFGNLEWTFPSLFHPDMSLQYYCLIPIMDADDNTHVSYTYFGIPLSFHYKDSTYVVDTTFVVHSNQQQLDSLASYAMKTTGSVKINPCPPKKPNP